MAMLPTLRVEFLEDEQIIYECHVRNISCEPLTSEVKSLLGKRVQQYVADPSALAYVDSDENNEPNLIRCVSGLKSLVNRTDINSIQRLHRAIHFYYRLKRIVNLSPTNLDRRERYIARAKEFSIFVQSLDPREPIPTDRFNWAMIANVVSDSVEGGTRTGTIPKVTITQPNAKTTIPPPPTDRDRTESGIEPIVIDEEKINTSINALQNRQDRLEDLLKSVHQTLLESSGSQPASIIQEPIFVQFQQQQLKNSEQQNQVLVHVVEQLRQMAGQQQQQMQSPCPNVNELNRMQPITNSSPYRPQSNASHIPDFQQSNPFADVMNTTEARDRDVSKKFQQFPRWNCRFSGSKVDDKTLSLNEYIATIRNFMMTVGVTSQEMIRQVFPTLRDDALRFYLTIQHNDLTLEEFFERLRERFGNKRGLTETILALNAIKFDEKKTIHDHIDEIIFQLKSADQHLSDTEQLTIICRTLPEEYSRPIRVGKVTTVAELKTFCYSVFPNNQPIRKRFEPKRVMTVDATSEDGVSDSECDLPIEAAVNVVRKWEKNFRNKNQRFSPSHSQPESFRKPIINRQPEIPASPKLYCGKCLTVGHASISCSEPPRRYCFKCGTMGETTNTCESDFCKASKNE